MESFPEQRTQVSIHHNGSFESLSSVLANTNLNDLTAVFYWFTPDCDEPYFLIQGQPDVVIAADYPLLIVAGLLVGFGTRLGSGCTSGHGICGMARLSKRSFAAVAVFMVSAFLTVWLMK